MCGIQREAKRDIIIVIKKKFCIMKFKINYASDLNVRFSHKKCSL